MLTAWRRSSPLRLRVTEFSKRRVRHHPAQGVASGVEAECSLREHGELGRGALTSANYEFTAAPDAAEGLVSIRSTRDAATGCSSKAAWC